MAGLQRELQALLELPDGELLAVAPAVSGWAPAQHVHHVATANRAFAGILSAIAAGKAEQAEGEPNRMGKIVLKRGKMPRGQAQVPDAIPRSDQAGRPEAAEALAKSAKRFAALAQSLEALAASPGRMEHAYLGSFGAEEWLRFATIHTRHHLEIIEDVRRPQTTA
jgi:hypothetical protein